MPRSRKLTGRAKAALLLSGCLVVIGLSAGPAPARQDVAPARHNASAASLRVVLAAQVNLDPIVASRGGQWVWSTFLDPLVRVDNQGRLTGRGIITGWRRVNPTTWRFTIRQGVQFTNGERGNSAAVANSIMLNKFTSGAILSTYFQNVISARAINARTVIVRTKLPQFNVVNQLSTVFLLPPKYYKEVGTRGFNAEPIGSGPFKVDSLLPGRSISVVPNSQYWGAQPRLSRVTFTYSPDPSQRLALVQSGSADVGMDLNPSQALQAGSSVKVLRRATTLKLILFQFANKPPLNNIRLRKAISMAVDRNRIVQGIFRGNARPDGGLLNVIPGQKASKVVNPNPAAARRLVSGSPSVTLNFPPDRYPNMPEVAQAIAAQLEAVGIDVRLVPESYVSGVTKVLAGQMSGLFITGAVPNVPDANFLAQGFLTKDSITKNCIDRRFDKLTAEALTKKDEKAAKPIYDRLNTLAVVNLACYVPLYGAITYVAMAHDVRGVDFTRLNTLYLDRTTKG